MYPAVHEQPEIAWQQDCSSEQLIPQVEADKSSQQPSNVEQDEVEQSVVSVP
jgi:hypothetical protein